MTWIVSLKDGLFFVKDKKIWLDFAVIKLFGNVQFKIENKIG